MDFVFTGSSNKVISMDISAVTVAVGRLRSILFVLYEIESCSEGNGSSHFLGCAI